MAGKKEIRYTLDGRENNAEHRLTKEYLDGRSGKGVLISTCLTAGYMMKEAGLAELLGLLDQDNTFKSLSGLEKRERIIALLTSSRHLIDAERPLKPVPTEAERHKAAAEPVIVTEPEPEPEPEPRKAKAQLPRLGN